MLEAMDQFLPNMDEQIASESAKIFAKQGLDIRLGARVTDVAVEASHVTVTYAQGDSAHTEEFDRLIVAVGRTPRTGKLPRARCSTDCNDETVEFLCVSTISLRISDCHVTRLDCHVGDPRT